MTPADYLQMYASAIVNPRKIPILNYICKVIFANENTYKLVELSSGVPWFIVAAIHYRESDQSFKRHLSNGDPLEFRTTHDPKGRPATGNPPFAWQTSAIDAMSNLWRPQQWDLAGCLEFIERYNGLGYQKHGINSPYLWDYTDKYNIGLYQMDGRFSPNVREDRAGCVAILKTLTPPPPMLQ